MYGTPGCDGVPSLGLDSHPVIGTQIGILVGNDGGAAKQCALFWSWQPEWMFVPLLGGILRVQAPFITVSGITVPGGGLRIPCDIAFDCGSVGNEIYVQTICMDPCGPAGLSLSKGLKITIGI